MDARTPVFRHVQIWQGDPGTVTDSIKNTDRRYGHQVILSLWSFCLWSALVLQTFSRSSSGICPSTSFTELERGKNSLAGGAQYVAGKWRRTFRDLRQSWDGLSLGHSRQREEAGQGPEQVEQTDARANKMAPDSSNQDIPEENQEVDFQLELARKVWPPCTPDLMADLQPNWRQVVDTSCARHFSWKRMSAALTQRLSAVLLAAEVLGSCVGECACVSFFTPMGSMKVLTSDGCYCTPAISLQDEGCSRCGPGSTEVRDPCICDHEW